MADVAHQYRRIAEARKEVELAQALQSSNTEALRVARNRYMQREAVLSDVVKLQSGLAEANHRYTQALMDLATAQADFEKAWAETDERARCRRSAAGPRRRRSSQAVRMCRVAQAGRRCAQPDGGPARRCRVLDGCGVDDLLRGHRAECASGSRVPRVGIRCGRPSDERRRRPDPCRGTGRGRDDRTRLARIRATDYQAVVDKAQGARDESSAGIVRQRLTRRGAARLHSSGSRFWTHLDALAARERHEAGV